MQDNLTPEDLNLRLQALEAAFSREITKNKGLQDKLNQITAAWQSERVSHNQVESAYQTLRIQKGGFGFKALSLSGFLGFCFGLSIGLFFMLNAAQSREKRLIRFQREPLFEAELAIQDGDFNRAEQVLKFCRKEADFQKISTEIVLIEKVVTAAKKRFSADQR
jgi:hypothetical protein